MQQHAEVIYILPPHFGLQVDLVLKYPLFCFIHHFIKQNCASLYKIISKIRWISFFKYYIEVQVVFSIRLTQASYPWGVKCKTQMRDASHIFIGRGAARLLSQNNLCIASGNRVAISEKSSIGLNLCHKRPTMGMQVQIAQNICL